MKTNHRRVSVPLGNENSQSPTGGLLPGQELAANFSYRPPQRTMAAVRIATVLCSVCAATILPQISAKIYGLGTTSVSESVANATRCPPYDADDVGEDQGQRDGAGVREPIHRPQANSKRCHRLSYSTRNTCQCTCQRCHWWTHRACLGEMCR